MDTIRFTYTTLFILVGFNFSFATLLRPSRLTVWESLPNNEFFIVEKWFSTCPTFGNVLDFEDFSCRPKQVSKWLLILRGNIVIWHTGHDTEMPSVDGWSSSRCCGVGALWMFSASGNLPADLWDNERYQFSPVHAKYSY